jgi:hypothetical protein
MLILSAQLFVKGRVSGSRQVPACARLRICGASPKAGRGRQAENAGRPYQHNRSRE